MPRETKRLIHFVKHWLFYIWNGLKGQLCPGINILDILYLIDPPFGTLNRRILTFNRILAWLFSNENKVRWRAYYCVPRQRGCPDWFDLQVKRIISFPKRPIQSEIVVIGQTNSSPHSYAVVVTVAEAVTAAGEKSKAGCAQTLTLLWNNLWFPTPTSL